jgi:hypothetical protein
MPVLASFLRTRTGAIVKKDIPKVRELADGPLANVKAKTLRETLKAMARDRHTFETAADRLDRDKSKSRWAGGRLMKIYEARVNALQLALPRAEKREAKEKAAKDKAKEKLKAAKAKARAKEKLKAKKAKAKTKAKTKVKKASKGNTPKARAHPPPIGRGKEVWVKWVLNGEEQRL